MTIDTMFLYHPRTCTECGERLSDATRTGMCKRCSARLRAQRRRAAWQAAGRCRNCGAELHDDRKQCPACLERQRQRRLRDKEDAWKEC